MDTMWIVIMGRAGFYGRTAERQSERRDPFCLGCLCLSSAQMCICSLHLRPGHQGASRDLTPERFELCQSFIFLPIDFKLPVCHSDIDTETVCVYWMFVVNDMSVNQFNDVIAISFYSRSLISLKPHIASYSFPTCLVC